MYVLAKVCLAISNYHVRAGRRWTHLAQKIVQYTEGIDVDKIFISLKDVKLYSSIMEEGTELYTTQDGCYAKYVYNGNIYILTICNGYVTIEMQEGSVNPDDTELPF